jgi:uncharacterized protein YdeI (YjbR/CyaY-like superfamily)
LESRSELWLKELDFIREISEKHLLKETIKWGQPCFTFKDKNIFIFGSFKHSCVISFFKGALLTDPKSLLQKAGENSQGATVLRFTSVEEIKGLEKDFDNFIRQSISFELTNIKPLKSSVKPNFPVELSLQFQKSPEFQAAFNVLTPGRQRGYLIYFNGAKESTTRNSRITKMSQRILAGKGIDDCICGLSKKMPRCDGSHKFA